MFADLSERLEKIAVLLLPQQQRLAHVLKIILGTALSDADRKALSRDISNKLLRVQRKHLSEKAYKALKEQLFGVVDKKNPENSTKALDYDLALEWLFKRYSVPNDAREEYRQQLYTDLLQSENLFNEYSPKKGNFLSYFMTLAESRLKNIFKREKFEREHFQGEGEEERQLMEQVPYEEEGFQQVEHSDAVNRIRQLINSRESLVEQKLPQIFDLFMEGYSQLEIAKKLKISPVDINRRLMHLKQVLKTNLSPDVLKQLMH